MKKLPLILVIWIIVVLSSCDHTSSPSGYKTRNVFVVIVDGARYSETWGDSTHQYIQSLAGEMAAQGILFTNFYNNGPTYTNGGHTAITTGYYQDINNSGMEYPKFPSMFQYWLNSSRKSNDQSWLVTSKDKLFVLADCIDSVWTGKFRPSVNCGIWSGGYRDDRLTLDTLINILSTQHPQLVFFSMRDPDYTAHQGNKTNYVNALKRSYDFANYLWRYTQTDPYYSNTTTFFITNDHGRHLDSITDGFASHGDGCEGCRHILLYASGPDFRKGEINTAPHELVDIPATIAELMQFKMDSCKGSVMKDIFK